MPHEMARGRWLHPALVPPRHLAFTTGDDPAPAQ